MENNSVLMPEIVIQRAITSMLDLVKSDYILDTSLDKRESLLYMFFKKDENGRDVRFNSMDYFHQSVELFTKKNIQINMGYNMEIADIPSVHILLPSENSRFLGIGADENYMDPFVSEIEIDNETVEFSRPMFTQTYDANYNIMITSPNVFEILLIYNLFKMGFLSLYENMEFEGIRNMKLGGQDITMQADLVPTHIFHRNLTLSFFYEMNSPRFFKEQLVKKFTTAITV